MQGTDWLENGERGMSLLLRYVGPSVDDGTMDVYDAAKNMVAFSDYVVAATHKVYGQEIQVRADVNAFQRGSFVTDLLFQVAGQASTILSTVPDLACVIAAVRESLQLFVFLRGEAPASIEYRDDRSVNVENNNGEVIQVNIESLHLTLDERAARAAAVFVGEALSKPGVSEIDVSSNGQNVAHATNNEARFFRPIVDETPLVEHVVNGMGLTIEEPSFKDGTGHRWTMWDGEASLQYAMEDEEFIRRVDAGEPFRKGDVLICDVKFTQSRSGSRLKIQRTIVRVHDHRIGEEQAEIDF